MTTKVALLIFVAQIIWQLPTLSPVWGQEPAKAKPLPLVQVQPVQLAPLQQLLDLTGSATPTRQARLASPSEGPVQQVRVREGSVVKKGERLVTIGRAGAAQAQVTAAAESLKEQAAELNRTKILVESGAIPGSQLDTARAKYEGAKALLAKAREQASDYAIEAPWDGIVSKVLVKDGDFVAPRTPLVEMYDPNSLVIGIAIPEAYVNEVTKGTAAQVQLDAYPGQTFPGKVSLVYPNLDTRMRTRAAEVTLQAPAALIPGMFARLKIARPSSGEALVIPSDAVLLQPNGDKVVFVHKKGKAERRLVQTGSEAGGRVQILAGLQPGEAVITAGQEKLKDGSAVQIQGGVEK
ncbi:MAG: efflux RND transporter periplasmic adaptor subunit [Desulfobacca sp.]|uniref:efflux RND transporter periplasmic adaptor subunit n=1 Tax=Desulfobacca sp. TaxID=2067990 RepID=UPI004048EEC1